MLWHPLASVRRRRRTADEQPTTRTYYPRRRPAAAGTRPRAVRRDLTAPGPDEIRARLVLVAALRKWGAA